MVPPKTLALLTGLVTPVNFRQSTLPGAPAAPYSAAIGTPTIGTPDAVTGATPGSLNATDPNGGTLTYAVQTAPRGGRLSVKADGSFLYTPTQASRLAAGSTLSNDIDHFVVGVSNGTTTTPVRVDIPIYSGQLATGGVIPVGQGPTGMAVFGDRIYVANSMSNTITAIDSRSGAVLANIPVGRGPTQLAVSATGDVVYVANRNDNTVMAVSTANGAILATMPVGYSPQGIAVGPQGRLYVSNTASNTVTVLNPTTGQTVATVAVGNAPVGVTLSPDGTRAYVANRGQNTVSVINTATNAVVATYAVGSMPQAIAVNAAGTRLYVTNSGSDNVTVLNTSTGAKVATVAVRDQPFGIVLSRDGSVAYVANSDSSVSVINTTTNTKITGTLRTETATGSTVALSSDGNTLYTAFSGGNTIRTASFRHVDVLPPANPGTPAGPVFNDFSGPAGSAPDPSVWSRHLGGGGATGEQHVYTDYARNASLDGNGNLVIRAIKEPVVVPGYGTFNYSSAYLTTQDKLEFTYGTVSARIKFPSQQGVLPAFWMLGSDIQTVGWPTGGEIDIMEVAPGVGGSSIHSTAGSYSVGTSQHLSGGFHEYWMRWEPNKITTGIDGVTLATFTPDSLPPGAPWTFNDRSMYAILNVAVGSPFGQPDQTTQFPAEMVVDWFRYTPLSPSGR